MKKIGILVSLLFLNSCVLLLAQQVNYGLIIDKNTNEPLPGAAIHLKNTDMGVVSSDSGIYELKHNMTLPFSLVVSYVGYAKKEVMVNTYGKLDIKLERTGSELQEVTVSSRRRKEIVQDVPIPISVLNIAQLENSGSFNVNRVKELVPSVQLYSSNPRNTTLNIRGLGSTFGLTNDGIDPGVGFYVDGVYYARPAATTIDFIDIEQIEVLRGPQGTLFGKNTTAGAFNVTTRKPLFHTGANFELSFGNLGFVQAKASITGPIIKEKLAARISFTGTNRNGTIKNSATGNNTNTLNNIGVRAQFLYKPTDKVDLMLVGDYTTQRPDGYAQVIAGVVKTQRAGYRQFDSIIADLGYTLPSQNPFDREIDHDTPWKSDQDMAGVSLNADIKIGDGKLTSTTAWRYWNWNPSNDRDFTGVQALRLSQAPSKHHQWSQEFRYSGQFARNLSGVAGLYAFGQYLNSSPFHTEEAGKDQWRFSQNSTSPLWQTPGLLDGYGIKTYQKFNNLSAAVFGQLDWTVFKVLSVLPGIRVNFDQKYVNFRRETYGGLQTEDPALLALKRSVYSNQKFNANVNKVNASGQLTLSVKAHHKVRIFTTYSLSFKPVGLNLGGLPNANGEPMTELAVIKPELVHHVELGIKSQPFKSAILNFTMYSTEVKDYQTLVQSPDLSVNRGYLANAERVRVFGGEVDLSYRYKKFITINAAVSYTNGKYVKFTNAPPPLEETGGPTFKDISGTTLPGISAWSGSVGAESAVSSKLLGQSGDFFVGLDVFYRTSFSSSPSVSQFLNVAGYALLNARVGFQASKGFSIFIWSRNLLNKNYFEQLLPGAGNSGQYAGVLGDPRTFGATLRYTFY